MQRSWCVLAIFLALAIAGPQHAQAQMGMDLFKRPAITKAFHPVVGKGAVYADAGRTAKHSAPSKSPSLASSFEGRKASGCSLVHRRTGERRSSTGVSYSRRLQMHRMIFQQQGAGHGLSREHESCP
jgi:hypothetical protein